MLPCCGLGGWQVIEVRKVSLEQLEGARREAARFSPC